MSNELVQEVLDRLDRMERQLERVEERLQATEERLARVETRLNNLEQWLETQNGRVWQMAEAQASLKAKVAMLVVLVSVATSGLVSILVRLLTK